MQAQMQIEEHQNNTPLMVLIQIWIYHSLFHETENRNFSVQFSLPLFTSGLNSSQRRQALIEEVKSEEQLVLIQKCSNPRN